MRQKAQEHKNNLHFDGGEAIKIGQTQRHLFTKTQRREVRMAKKDAADAADAFDGSITCKGPVGIDNTRWPIKNSRGFDTLRKLRITQQNEEILKSRSLVSILCSEESHCRAADSAKWLLAARSQNE